MSDREWLALAIGVVVVALVVIAVVVRRRGSREPTYGSDLEKNIEEMRKDAPFKQGEEDK